MSDLHITENIGRTYPAVINLGRPGRAADDLISSVIRGGLGALHGYSCADASTALSAALVALDTEEAGYQAAADYLSAVLDACRAAGASCVLHVNS